MPAIDKFKNSSTNVGAPGDDFFEITPDDNNELPFVTRGLCFVTAGDLHVITSKDVEITLPSGLLVAGIIHPARIKKLFATGTTATDIYGVV